MSIEVIMPQLGESIVEGTVTKWLKEEGDSIEEFEPLLEVNTDKVDTEIPSPASGNLLKVYVDEGQTVEAGTVLAMLGEPGERVPEVMDKTVETTPPELESAEPEQTATVEATQPSKVRDSQGDLGFISPVVAKIAAEHQVDLLRVEGTGSKGRITKKDVLAYVKRKGQSPWEEPASGELFRPTEEIFGVDQDREVTSESQLTAGTTIPVDVIRKTIAEHMLRSRQTSPHVTTVVEADLSRVVAHRKRHKAKFDQEGVNLTFLSYIVSATVSALKEWPIVNSTWKEKEILLHKEMNVGIAVSLGEGGLIVPVVDAADQLSLLGIAQSIQDLAQRARDRKLKPDEVQGGTFTITNHGASGSLFAAPIINQPQAAILGVGKIQKRVVVIEALDHNQEAGEAIAIRPMVYLSLTFDHRILDGAIADFFLGDVVSQLENWS